jgi:hypothetical protein
LRKLWLHIGSHKTGTTYMQQQFAKFEAEMAGQGVLYPKTGRALLWGQHQLSSWVQNKSQVAEAKAKVAAELAGHGGDVLVSSETMEYLKAEHLREIAEWFQPAEVEVLYFYRHWTGLLYSGWQEEVKHGSDIFFPDFAFEHVVFHRNSRTLNFGEPVAKAEAAFGPGTVRIANYETVKANGDIAAFVLERLGVKGLDPKAEKLINQSMIPSHVELLRALNALMKESDMSQEESNKLRKYYLRTMKKRADPAVRKLVEMMEPHIRELPELRKSTVARAFLRKFLETHASKFILPEDAEAAQGTEPPSHVSPGYLLNPEAPRMIHAIFDRIVENSWNERESQPKA